MLVQRYSAVSPWSLLMKSSFSGYLNYSLYIAMLWLDSSDYFSPVSLFHCEQHWYLSKQIVPTLSPLLQNPTASSYSPSSPSKISTWAFPLVSRFHCEQHQYLRKQIVPPMSPLLQNPLASRYSPSSPSRISSWIFPPIPKIFALFSSSLVAGSLWINVHTCFSCSNKRPSSVLTCTISWVVLSCYLSNNYPLHWLCPQHYPLIISSAHLVSRVGSENQ